MNDYLDRLGLLRLDLDGIDADRLLQLTYLTGHDKHPVVESERLAESWSMKQETSNPDSHCAAFPHRWR